MKCYKELFTIEGLKNNIGNYILLILIINNIICAIILVNGEFKSLINIIHKIISKDKLDTSIKDTILIKKLKKENINNNKKMKFVKRKKNTMKKIKKI